MLACMRIGRLATAKLSTTLKIAIAFLFYAHRPAGPDMASGAFFAMKARYEKVVAHAELLMRQL